MKQIKAALCPLLCFLVLFLSACDSNVPFVEIDSSGISSASGDTSDTAENPGMGSSAHGDTEVTSQTQSAENPADIIHIDTTTSKNGGKSSSGKTTKPGKKSDEIKLPEVDLPDNVNVDDTPTVEVEEEEFTLPPETTTSTPSGQGASTEPVTGTSSQSLTSANTTSAKPVTYGNYKAISDSDRFCYKYANLNTAQKKLYADIKNAVKEKTSTIDLPSTPYPSELVFILQCVTDDHPEFYWADSSYSYTTNPSGKCTTLTLKYIDSGDVSKLTAAVKAFVGSVPDGLSEYEVELMAHDYICEAAVYDSDTAYYNSTANPFARTAYGALVTKSCVCEGYSRAMELLLYSVGIECSLVRGNTGEEPHMWNQAYIGGAWYNVDVTWDDPMNMPDGAPLGYFHAFFNITDKELEESNHVLCPLYSTLSKPVTGNGATVNMFNITVKPCTKDTMNYYVKTSTRLKSESTDEAIIAAAVLKADSEGRDYCEFQAVGDSKFTQNSKGMAQLIFNAFKRGLKVNYVTPSGVSGKYLVKWTFN